MSALGRSFAAIRDAARRTLHANPSLAAAADVDTAPPAPALLACSHGTSSPTGQRCVQELVNAVADARPELAVRGGFVDVQQPDVPASIDALAEAPAVTIVPLLLSAGYHVHVDLAEAAADRSERNVRVSGALGPDIRLARVLAHRLSEAGLACGDSVVLAVAGSSDSSAVQDCWAMGDLLSRQIGRPVQVGFISAAHPRLDAAVRSVREQAPSERVVVATYLLAPGYFADLTHRAGADVVTEPLLSPASPVPNELVDIVLDRYDMANRPAFAAELQNA